MKHAAVTRRLFLEGAGVTLALPWLESRAPRAAAVEGSTAAGGPPLRLCVTFSGNGFHSKEWWARGAGREMELGRVLEPLADFRERLLFVGGLYHEEARKGNIHSSQTGNMLSGAPIAAGGTIRSGTSFDQVLARAHGRGTRVPSLVLGCEQSNPSVHKNYSMLYSSHISWSSPTTPVPLELYPALAFDRLFKDETTPEDRSVIDAVLGDARDLARSLGAEDRTKLDEYLESVRDVERRIAAAGDRGELQGWRPTLAAPDIVRPADGIPQDIAEHMRLMIDIIVLGFQTDTTRIATLKLNNDHSALRFPNLPSVQNPGHGIDAMIHHLLSHSDGEDWLAVNRFFMEQVAYLARRLDEIREGDRTLLDRTILMHCSSMMAGARHDNDRLPVIVLGGAAAGLEGGRVLDYAGSGERQLCRLFLSLLTRMGLPLDSFGDATAPLAEV